MCYYWRGLGCGCGRERMGRVVTRTDRIIAEILAELEQRRAEIDGANHLATVMVTVNLDHRTHEPDNVLCQIHTRRPTRL